MIGAIAGDIIGSPHEFKPHKSVDFPLFSAGCRFIDDTVLTIALAEAILTGADYAIVMKQYYQRYPDAGYGGGFRKWAVATDSKPYRSRGHRPLSG